jgi:hypothetical protein
MGTELKIKSECTNYVSVAELMEFIAKNKIRGFHSLYEAIDEANNYKSEGMYAEVHFYDDEVV